MNETSSIQSASMPWNKGKLIGAKPPLRPFVNGRANGGGSVGGLALGFASNEPTRVPPELAAAYAPILAKAPPPSFQSLSAVFQTLPGASFTVSGAPVAHDSALASAGAQLFLTPRWTLLAKFDGEFATGS